VTVTAQAGPVQAPKTNATAKRAPAITALIARVRSGARPSVDESPFVFGGEAYVRVTLANASADALERLRKAGFTITRQERNEVTGHIAVEKLEAITQFDFVVWIAPR
jgi:glycine cleavage system regulatory protein